MVAVGHGNHDFGSVSDDMLIRNDITVVGNYVSRAESVNFLLVGLVAEELSEEGVVLELLEKGVVVFANFRNVNSNNCGGYPAHRFGNCIASCVGDVFINCFAV